MKDIAEWLASLDLGEYASRKRAREPGGCRRQYRRRGGREGTPRWLYASASWHPECDNATLYTNLSFNFIRDIAPVSGIMRVSYVIVVHPSVPATTVPEFIAYAKANPGKINMASAGSGTPQHIYGELFKMMAGVNLVHVPYRGGAPAITDLLGGQVQVIFSPVPESIEHITAGKLHPLAAMSGTRLEVLPNLPMVGDFLPGYEASGWQGIGAPKNTPAEIIDKLNKEIGVGLTEPKIKARIADLGGVVLRARLPHSGGLSQMTTKSSPR